MSNNEVLLHYIDSLVYVVRASVKGEIHQGHMDILNNLIVELSNGIKKEQEMEKAA